MYDWILKLMTHKYEGSQETVNENQMDNFNKKD